VKSSSSSSSKAAAEGKQIHSCVHLCTCHNMHKTVCSSNQGLQPIQRHMHNMKCKQLNAVLHARHQTQYPCCHTTPRYQKPTWLSTLVSTTKPLMGKANQGAGNNLHGVHATQHMPCTPAHGNFD
jgi:hypothetical protein